MNVKTFFRVLGIIALYSPLSGLINIVYLAYSNAEEFYYKNEDSALERCNDAVESLYMLQCYKAVTLQRLPAITVTVVVPIIELILYPVFVRCCYFNLKILTKGLLGILMLLLYEVIFIAETVPLAFTSYEGNSTCFFDDSQISTNSEIFGSEYAKIIYQQPLYGLAVYILSTSGIEFVCAQSPYSMKGFIFGVLFVTIGFSVGLSYGLILVLHSSVHDRKCGIWLHTSLAGALIITIFIHAITTKCYKFRKREDVLTNEQIFAVNYFDKYLTSQK